MRILMIGISDDILSNPVGDVRDRHMEYARRAGALDMIVYSPYNRKFEVTKPTPELTIYPTRSLSHFHFVSDAFKLGCRIMEQSKADIITTQDPFATGLAGYLLKRRFDIPLEVQNHSDFFDNKFWIAEKPFRYRVFNTVGKFIVRRAEALRVINREEAAKYLDMGIPKERIQIQPTPVNVANFCVLPENGDLLKLRWQLGLNSNERVVLWVGRLVACKHLELWLKTLKLVRQRYPDVRGLVVGDLKLAPGLPELVKRLELEEGVIFPGRVEHDHLPTYFALADIYLLTSIYEGLGKVLVEAGAAGLPVVTTPTAGGREVVLPEKTGIISEGEPRALADSTLRLLDNPELGQQMGRAAREWVNRRFDREASLASIVAAWRYIAGLEERR